MRIRALLVISLAAAALAGCTGVPAPTTPTPSSSLPSTPAEPAPASTPTPTFTPVDPAAYPNTFGVPGVAFDSPSGNIHCGYEQSATGQRTYEIGGCAVDEYTFAFAELEPGESARCTSSSQQAWGGGFTLHDGVVAVQCRNGGGLFWPGELDGYESPALPYGSSITFADMICESTEDGMTCRSLTTGHGFRLSRSDYELF